MKKSIWFKQKTYGWGWTPCTWQGFLVILLWAVLFAYILMTRIGPYDTFLPVSVITIALIAISWIKGEKPRWRWG